jgi:hypothetical protein
VDNKSSVVAERILIGRRSRTLLGRLEQGGYLDLDSILHQNLVVVEVVRELKDQQSNSSKSIQLTF